MKKVLFVCFILSQSVFAGGSASQEHILDMLASDLSAFVQSSYELEEAGECVRVEGHLENEGEKVLPCSIVGTFKKTGNKFSLSFSEDGEAYSEEEL